MKPIWLVCLLIAVITASLIPTPVHAAPVCLDECPNTYIPYFCDYNWTFEKGYASKGDLHCGHWFAVPELPGLEASWGMYFWVPNICSIGGGYDESTGKYFLMGSCED
jgi:hypothetical protein